MTDWWWFVLAAAVGYAVGAVNPATIIARARGIDIRAEGSGNPGATNIGRILGRRSGVLVAVLDILKGFLPALAFGQLVSAEAGLVAGLAAVLGHVTSPLLRGKGGKGVATSAGAMLASTPAAVPWVLLVFGIVALTTKWVALASVCGVVALFVVVSVQGYGWAYEAWVIGILLIVLVRHRRNFTRAVRNARAARRAGPTGGGGDAADS